MDPVWTPYGPPNVPLGSLHISSASNIGAFVLGAGLVTQDAECVGYVGCVDCELQQLFLVFSVAIPGLCLCKER